jgi:hypothetical protein
MAATGRRRAIDKALTALLPRVPYLDAEAIRETAGRRHMRELSVDVALWLATLAHIRHAHTEYDALRDEGYERDDARFFVVDEVNAVLDRWGAGRRLVSEPAPEEIWPD